MELSSLKPNPTTVVDLVHPDPAQNPTGVTITLASRDSEEVRAAMTKAAEKRILLIRKGKSPSVADIEAEAVAVLVAAVQGWDGLTVGGEPLPCTPEAVRGLVQDHAWVRRQLDDAMGNEALFFEK
jgi:hypothetical protein